MSEAAFPSKELLEVIKSQSRMEAKLDTLISGLAKLESETKDRVEDLDGRVKALESDAIRAKTYAAVGGGAAGLGASILIPWLKTKLGL